MRASLVLRHARYQVREALRAPGYLFPVYVFPTMFFLYFAQPGIETPREAALYLGCYSLYAILGVVFYLFLAEVSDDRHNAWENYLQTLPHGSWVRLTAWALTSLLAGVVAALLIGLTVLVSTPLEVGVARWSVLLVVALLGAAPFGLLAMTLAYWTPPKFTQPVANVVYFSLAFAGGFWTLPRGLPGWLSGLSPYFPTRMWAELGWAVVDGRPWPFLSTLGLLAYGVAFGIAAYAGMHRYLREAYR